MSRDPQSPLELHGLTVLKNGYNVVPIEAGQKRPRMFGWTTIQTTDRDIREWCNAPGRGVGITTKHTPAVDIDVRDEEVVELVDAFVVELLGLGPQRIGRSPKSLRLFRTEQPFRKMSSAKYSDDAVRGADGKWIILGDKHQIEILGDGQQFAAYGIHPDTNLPYRWPDVGNQPTVIHADDLPLITMGQAQEIIDYFEGLAEARGWVQLTPGRKGGMTGGVGADDWTADIEQVLDISLDELRDDLMSLPGRDDYEGWLEIGFAVYHQTGGSEDGRALFHEWSATLPNYDADELDEKWDGGHLEIHGRGRKPVTWRSIKHYLKETAADRKVALQQELREAFRSVETMADWEAAAEQARRAEIDAITRDSLVEIARERYQRVSDSKITAAAVRKALAFELDTTKMPDWCAPWIYDTSDDKFVSMETKAVLTQQGFNAMHNRFALTKKDKLEGRTMPSASAYDVAVTKYRIQCVGKRMYAPGESAIFHEDGVVVANLYRDDLVPEAPTKLRPKDKRNIKLVRDHIAHLLDDPDDQRVLLDWLAWVVQNPGRRVNWAILLQGTEGDGKSFFTMLLAATMGNLNVRMVNAKSLEGGFSDWAHGQCVVGIEEVKLHGGNNYDVLNSIKPFITNQVIEIHPKGRAQYNVTNTSNYFMTSNYINALPLTENDRRYCILSSKWQSGPALRAFVDANPDYYRELYRALEESGPALRRWLLDHEVSRDFPAGGNAPRTKAHAVMVRESKPQFLRDLDVVIKQGEWATISEHLVSVTDLADVLIGEGSDMPSARGLHRSMTQNGFIEIGRLLIGDVKHRFWTKTPEMFREGAEFSMRLVKRYVEKRQREIDENEL